MELSLFEVWYSQKEKKNTQKYDIHNLMIVPISSVDLRVASLCNDFLSLYLHQWKMTLQSPTLNSYHSW